MAEPKAHQPVGSGAADVQPNQIMIPECYNLTINGKPADFFTICEAVGYPDEPLLHAAKKLLFAGKRGKKDKAQDVREAMQSCQRWLEENDGEVSSADVTVRPPTGSTGLKCGWTCADHRCPPEIKECRHLSGHSGPHSWEA